MIKYRVSQKNARFSKIENITDLLSDDKKGKIIQNIDFYYFSNRASFLGNPVDDKIHLIHEPSHENNSNFTFHNRRPCQTFSIKTVQRWSSSIGNPCSLLRSWKIDLFDDVASCLLFSYFFLSVIQEFYYSEESNKKRRCKKSESNTNFT